MRDIINEEMELARGADAAPHPAPVAPPLVRSTGHQRLKILADFLDTKVPAERFHLKLWSDEGFPKNECGTAACAVGWATTIPEFAADGLHLEPWPGGGKCTVLMFGAQAHWSAAERFFELEHFEAKHLFGENAYSDPTDKRAVVSRIRSFLAEQEG